MATTQAGTAAVTKVATTQTVTLETIIGIASTALTKFLAAKACTAQRSGGQMNKPFSCLRCNTEMAAGFVVDLTEHGPGQEHWFPGKPEPGFWVGLKGLRKEQRVPVTTLRCPSCGYLESYANRVDPDV